MKNRTPACSIVKCDETRHAAAILAIFNDAILHSSAIYEYKPRTMDMMTTWFAAKKAGNWPVIGLENDQGELTAFASYGTFRERPGYKYTVEHSVYVHKDHRGHGFGRIALTELIATARNNDFHALVGGIDATNQASIALHQKLGFRHVGTLPEVAYKFGRWLDLAFYQLTLDRPINPVEG